MYGRGLQRCLVSMRKFEHLLVTFFFLLFLSFCSVGGGGGGGVGVLAVVLGVFFL